MPKKLKINSLIVFALAVVFAIFFNITKHQATLSSVNPFAEDPYDAIGSFAFQAVLLFGLIALFRAFRPYPASEPSDQQKVLLARTQVVIVLCVAVTLVGDLVALIRHWSLWSGQTGGLMLLLITVGFLLVTTVLGAFVYRFTIDKQTLGIPSWGLKPVLVLLLSVLVLFIYPEDIRESVPGALFTVVIGAFLLFMTVWAWSSFLFPGESRQQTVTPRWLWAVVILIGALLGFSIVLRELTAEGGAVDLMGNLFIISVFVGLEVAAILIGYAFLGKFLGLFQVEGKH